MTSDFVHRFERRESSRTLLLLHGTGGTEDDMLPLGRRIDQKAALLSPRGKVLENGAPRFFRRLAEGVFDEEDVKRRADELAQFVDHAAVEYGIDLNELVAIGYSNGANIAAAMLLLGLAKFRALILLRAMPPLSSNDVPQLAGYRVLISVGSTDQIVPASEGQRLGDMLREAGAAVTIETQAAGHRLVLNDVTVAQRWVALL
ncbi:MAG: alpha/beta hydrolase [Chthoniobacterales bacterium]